MYRTMAIALAAGALIAAPAFAQTGSQQGQSKSQTQQQSGAQTKSGQAGGSNITAMSRDKLKQSLQQAGFKNIQVIDAAYQVHARTSDGDFVTMLVNTTAGGQGSGATGQSGSGAASGGKSADQASAKQELKQSLQKAGFQSVQVVDATYLVQAQTPDGDRAIMMIDPPSTTGQQGGGSTGSSGGSGTSQ